MIDASADLEIIAAADLDARTFVGDASLSSSGGGDGGVVERIGSGGIGHSERVKGRERGGRVSISPLPAHDVEFDPLVAVG